MKKIRWVIQELHYAVKDRDQLVAACERLGLSYLLVDVIPFSDVLADFPHDDGYENIYYGSTTMMERVYRDFRRPIGLFYDHSTFRMENYLDKWGKHMLSSEAKVTTFAEFVQAGFPASQQFFIRPDADSKAFAGTVLDFGAIRDWHDRIVQHGTEGLRPDTKILAGPAYHIEKEWRNVVINGKVVCSSAYCKNFKPYLSAEDVPQEMIDFVEARCKEYIPHGAFAMDVAKCSGEHEYYIIECGCLNSIGFYAADIYEYVKGLSEYVARIINKTNIQKNNSFFEY